MLAAWHAACPAAAAPLGTRPGTVRLPELTMPARPLLLSLVLQALAGLTSWPLTGVRNMVLVHMASVAMMAPRMRPLCQVRAGCCTAGAVGRWWLQAAQCPCSLVQEGAAGAWGHANCCVEPQRRCSQPPAAGWLGCRRAWTLTTARRACLLPPIGCCDRQGRGEQGRKSSGGVHAHRLGLQLTPMGWPCRCSARLTLGRRGPPAAARCTKWSACR